MERGPTACRSDDSPSVGAEVHADEWVTRLTTVGPVRDEAISQLHELTVRAARHQISRMPEAFALGATTRDELANAAADEATVAILAKLHTFEGRSRFTTWAYKFGILHAGVQVRRTRWAGREVAMSESLEPAEPAVRSPQAHVEALDLAKAVHESMTLVLTRHQRQVAIALLVEDVPIDVLADRMGTTRNALYKTLHDARKRLRIDLHARGFETSEVVDP